MPKTVANSDSVVEAAGLTKIFRDFWMRAKAKAVYNITFQINRGELFGLLGPNGSGKSTTIKLILGLLNRTAGRLTVFGRDPFDVATKRFIGFLPEESYLYPYLNSHETLDYYGRLYGLDRKTRRRRSEELLDMVGLSQVAHRHVGEFSKGMMRRIGLAQALINDPEFLILDEPTSGLDPLGTRQVKDLLIEMRRRGKTILLSSHLLSDVQDVCDRMTILYGGQIHAEGTSDELLVESDYTIIRVPRIRNDQTIIEIEKVLQESEGIAIESVQQPRQNLESFFIQIVDKARASKIATSGADVGETAPFLRGDEEGEVLIDKLVETQDQDKRSEEAIEDVSKDKVSDDASMLEELVSKEEEPTRAQEAKTEQAIPEGTDPSVIEGLLQKDETEEEQDSQ